jgi:hypothetical protein
MSAHENFVYIALRSPWGWVENAAAILLSRARVMDGLPAGTSLLRFAEPRVVCEWRFDLFAVEIEAEDEAPRKRMAFGRSNMIVVCAVVKRCLSEGRSGEGKD